MRKSAINLIFKERVCQHYIWAVDINGRFSSEDMNSQDR